MTDVRDVYFQSEPFAMLPFPVAPGGDNAADGIDQGRILVFQEDKIKDRIIQECEWNSGWIRDCFGAKVFSRVV